MCAVAVEHGGRALESVQCNYQVVIPGGDRCRHGRPLEKMQAV